MSRRLAAFALLAAVAALSGCATGGDRQLASLTQERAAALLVPGQTTKDEVRRHLGDALVTDFPSGRAVWFYQNTDSAARLVRYVPLLGRMSATGTRLTELKIQFGADARVEKFKLQEIRAQ